MRIRCVDMQWWWWWSPLYITIFHWSRLTALLSHVILSEWLAFYSAFGISTWVMYLQHCSGVTWRAHRSGLTVCALSWITFYIIYIYNAFHFELKIICCVTVCGLYFCSFFPLFSFFSFFHQFFSFFLVNRWRGCSRLQDSVSTWIDLAFLFPHCLGVCLTSYTLSCWPHSIFRGWTSVWYIFAHVSKQ